MIEIKPLTHFDPERFQTIASGYRTDETYQVSWAESDKTITFSLNLEPTPAPREFRFPYSSEELEKYQSIVPSAYCWGAYDGDLVVGIALAEPQAWNRTLWVWEFHIAGTHQRRGVGRRLMAALAECAHAGGLRALVCETQNTNVPAIRFYRAVGYALEGVDVSYYTNEDRLPGRTVAVFMKLRLE